MVLPFGWGIYRNIKVSPRQITVVRQAARSGFSAKATQKLLKDEGIGFRRTSMLAVRREALGRIAKQSALNSIGLNRRPSARLITRTGQRLATQYRYTFRAELRLQDGSLQDMPINFGDDVLLTRGEAIERAESIMNQAFATDAAREGYFEGAVNLKSDWGFIDQSISFDEPGG